MKNTNFILQTGNNYDDEDNDYADIFKSKPKIGGDNNMVLNPLKIDVQSRQGSVFSQNTGFGNSQNDKLMNAKNILDNHRERLESNNNKGGLGLTSNIGFLNMNSSLGKNSLLNPLNATQESQDENNKENNENDEFNYRKHSKNANINKNFADRLSGTAKRNPQPDDDIQEIQEIQTIKISKEPQKQQTPKHSETKNENIQDFNKEKPLPQLNSLKKMEDQEKERMEMEKKLQEQKQQQMQQKNQVDMNDPKTKLHNLIMSKEDIDKINLKYFLYT